VRVNGELMYVPSGNEPLLFVTSRRGVPYHARGVNEKEPSERWEPHFLTLDYASSLHGKPRAASFGRDVWPAIVREVELAYTLAEGKELGVSLGTHQVKAALLAGPKSYAGLRQQVGLEPAGFPWGDVLEPRISVEGAEGLDAYQLRALAYLEKDIAEARRGNKSGAFKAALDVFRDIRNEVRHAVQRGMITDNSFRDELTSFYTPFNSFVSIGPPLYRIEQVAAAIRAGVVTMLPAGAFFDSDSKTHTVTITGRYFSAEPVSVDVVIEARQQRVDAANSANCFSVYFCGFSQTGLCQSAEFPEFFNFSRERKN